MDKIDQLFHKAFNLKSNIVYFPIRHHSPACSYHLIKTIQSYRPQVILIEGPYNTNGLIQDILLKENRLPIAIYYSFNDSTGLLGEEEAKYMCYYPFLEYSPEYTALLEGEKMGIEVEFIDLPYEEILLYSERDDFLKESQKKKNYNDDYLLMRSKFMEKLCERESCRSYNELWEKLYEIEGLSLSTEIFVKNIFTYCYLSRIDYTEEMLKKNGCLYREGFMKDRIEGAKKKHSRILVVTGGFHTPGLLMEEKGLKIERKNKKKSDVSVYLMPYSFEESDALNGYASGMPYPSFYQRVWENLDSQNPFIESINYFITKNIRELRRKKEVISTADGVEALNMAKGLSALRNKKAPGLYELLDGVKTSFIKGEENISSSMPLVLLQRLLTGDRIGQLSDRVDMPPLVMDFRNKCRRYKIDIKKSKDNQRILEIYRKERHREISIFFHILEYLDVGFCKKIKGADFIQRKDINLIREIWRHRWSPAIESGLIELSIYGGTLEECALEIIKKDLRLSKPDSQKATELLIKGALMALDTIVEELMNNIENIIASDEDFKSLVKAIGNLELLSKYDIFQNKLDKKKLKALIVTVYQKASKLVFYLKDTSKEEERHYMELLKTLYTISLDKDFDLDIEVLKDQLKLILEEEAVNPSILGTVCGIMYSLGELKRDGIVSLTKSYIMGIGEKLLEAARFLKGLFYISRDIVILNTEFLKTINNMIKSLDYDDFIKVVPELRLAFSFFTPLEIDGIGEKVAAIYEVRAVEISKRAVDEREIMKAKELEEKVRLKLMESCFLNG